MYRLKDTSNRLKKSLAVCKSIDLTSFFLGHQLYTLQCCQAKKEENLQKEKPRISAGKV